jgi:hypothetical protein
VAGLFPAVSIKRGKLRGVWAGLPLYFTPFSTLFARLGLRFHALAFSLPSFFA